MGRQQIQSLLSPTQARILDYLLDNTNEGSYLVATLNARQASPYILTTERPVLTFGGFKGSDNVIDAEGLAEMVAEGELRFVLGDSNLNRQKPDIAKWLQRNCSVVNLPGLGGAQMTLPGNLGSDKQGEPGMLYDCGAISA
jgi:4-amino-4-deoxy-L-arabinose transferase-like glycosyltransferase